MAKSSKSGSSLKPPDTDQRKEAWKSAPSRETTHDDPEGEDMAIERARKPLENAPGTQAETERSADDADRVD